MLLPITNFSWLKEKEMCLWIIREVTDSHLQQNSLTSEEQDQASSQRGFGNLFAWSHSSLQLTCGNYEKKANYTCSLSTAARP